MTRKRGPRSEKARQRRFVSRLVSLHAHRDPVRAESVNLLTPGDIGRALRERFGGFYLGLTQAFTRAEVLSDGRGEGSLQRVEA